MYTLSFILFTYIPSHTNFVGCNIDEIGMQKDMLGEKCQMLHMSNE